LNSISCCIEDKFSLAFALIRFGNPVLEDAVCVTELTNWLAINGKSLNPSGAVNILRPIQIILVSDYLRVVGQQGLFGPSAALLAMAGF